MAVLAAVLGLLAEAGAKAGVLDLPVPPGTPVLARHASAKDLRAAAPVDRKDRRGQDQDGDRDELHDGRYSWRDLTSVGVSSRMLENLDPEVLEGAAEALKAVSEALRGVSGASRRISIERALSKAARTGEAKGAALEALSSEVGTPAFMLDTWSEDPKRTYGQIATCLDRVQRRLESLAQVQRHPDNVPELLSGERGFGLVFFPKRLLQELHALGESVVELIDRRTGKDRVETHNVEVMLEAARWIRYLRKKRGAPPNSELVPVSPLTDKMLKEAKPDEPIDPPF